ncbi:MAG: ribose 5-phosphate isomerase B [Oscillospiraceae bacterium]|nr:ribose 5-phosphate isomerase B [Oscillospiraceae bacterium]
MIFIGSDHGGYATKEFLKKQLERRRIPYTDCGCDGSSVDYPDIAEVLCRKVLKDSANKGVLVCGTGIGMSIAANKIAGVRAALCADWYSAKLTRQHNNSNVLCLGGRTIGEEVAWELLEIWLNTAYPGDPRHAARVEKVAAIEASERDCG